MLLGFSFSPKPAVLSLVTAIPSQRVFGLLSATILFPLVSAGWNTVPGITSFLQLCRGKVYVSKNIPLARHGGTYLQS
jgi:hypothetical protein